MPTKDFILSQEILKELIHYNPDTGVFIWKFRDRKWFDSDKCFNWWNTRFANKVAGSVLKRNYIQIYVLDEQHRAHRLAWLYMTGEWPSNIDHENGNGLDNSWKNLRNVSHFINMQNVKRRKDNSSGLTGVYWSSPHKKWRARIDANRITVHLGIFNDWFDAVCARKSAENKYGFHINHGRLPTA